jgi:hypothetical protein
VEAGLSVSSLSVYFSQSSGISDLIFSVICASVKLATLSVSDSEDGVSEEAETVLSAEDVADAALEVDGLFTEKVPFVNKKTPAQIPTTTIIKIIQPVFFHIYASC